MDQDFNSILQGIYERMNAKQKEIEGFLDTLPQEQYCSKHLAVTALLDRNGYIAGQPHSYICQQCLMEATAAKRIEMLRERGIPEDALTATVDNFRTDRPNVKPEFQRPAQFVEAARKLISREVRNLLLAGTPGIGKGHLAAAVAIERLDAGKGIAWDTCSGLFNDYHKAYQDGSGDSVLRWYQRADLLVLDELCLRPLPADGEEILFAVLDYRHKAKLQTILLGNKPADETREWLGGRITDRLRSGGLAFRYGEWDSMRGTDLDGSQFEM